MSQPDTFAARLTALRTAAGLTRNALAVKANVAPILLNRYEAGERTPMLETAQRIAKALGVGGDVWDGVVWPKKGGK